LADGGSPADRRFTPSYPPILRSRNVMTTDVGRQFGAHDHYASGRCGPLARLWCLMGFPTHPMMVSAYR
jgi:hypothetical protein